MKRVVISLLLLAVLCTVSFGQNPGSAAKTLPQIVGRFKRVGQTDPIPSTVMFTPKSTGLFRISGLLLITTPAGSGSWSADLSWTDARKESVVGFSGTGSNGAFPAIGDSVTFVAHAGEPVKITVNAQGNVGGSVYDAFYVIERLTKIPSF